MSHLLVALLTFNVGVEAGQLLVVGLSYLAYRFLLQRPQLVHARTTALYVIGSVAAWWSLGRVVTLFA
jgi:hypothetical protein